MLRVVLRGVDRDEVPPEPKLVVPPLEWSPEALKCLERAESLLPPWTSLDLLRTVKQSLGWSALRGLDGDRAYDPEEPVSADGTHSTGWQRAVSIASYLARWQHKPQPVLPQHLLAGLGWAEEGEASKRLLNGAPALRGKLTAYLNNVRRLPIREIQRLERELRANPNDIFIRCQLLFAHSWPQARNRRRSLKEYEAHARWILEHRPDHPVLRKLHLASYFELGQQSHGREIDRLILQLLEDKPEDRQVIRAVAERWRDKRPRLSRELLKKIRHDRPKIDLELGEISSELGDWEDALGYAKAAAEKSEGPRRANALRVCFEAQLALQKWDDAESTIRELGTEESEETALHGLLAAAKGDEQEAERRLKGSPWDYRLTTRLLANVRLEAALEYLENLRKMDKPPIRKARIREIGEALRAGQPIRFL